ncbi:MAG TPA: nickel pincer cofactor biosynthesis protein LarC [Terriglobales bacterium]|nr:nickel pincer cofactor biosynthesis protein LarC [Terriglobales bacterium]
MRIAYLDCFSGISGDMFLGALLDAGVPAVVFEKTVAGLNLGAQLEISRVTRSGISATKIDVLVHGEKELPREVFWQQEAHKHDHDHGHPLAGVPASHEYGRSHDRGLREIKDIISRSQISENVKRMSIAIFQALGEAEAQTHNTDIEKVHFHEVGAVDAMVDIVCAAAGAEFLQVDEWVCSPLNVGGGTVQCAHGTFPVPAPATIELLKGAPVYSSGLNFELVTPTGAAIVKTLAKRFGLFPEMKIERAGYGAGTRDNAGHANVLRLTLGEPALEFKSSQEMITVLEANLDDLNPQVFGYVMDRLLEEGALEAFGLPVQMKKNRPGMLLTVLCKPEDAAKLSELIFAETTTLGIRHRDEPRQILQRKWLTVATRWGDVRLKIASMNGTVTNYAPEYEDCRRIAVEHRVPLKTVMQEAVQGYLGSTRDRK